MEVKMTNNNLYQGKMPEAESIWAIVNRATSRTEARRQYRELKTDFIGQLY